MFYHILISFYLMYIYVFQFLFILIIVFRESCSFSLRDIIKILLIQKKLNKNC